MYEIVIFSADSSDSQELSIGSFGVAWFVMG